MGLRVCATSQKNTGQSVFSQASFPEIIAYFGTVTAKGHGYSFVNYCRGGEMLRRWIATSILWNTASFLHTSALGQDFINIGWWITFREQKQYWKKDALIWGKAFPVDTLDRFQVKR